MPRDRRPSKAAGRKARRTSGSIAPVKRSRPPSIDAIADIVVRGGRELDGVEDPLEAELWASAMLGTFYKIDAPLDARDELDRMLWPAVLRKAEAAGDIESLGVLEALAAVADNELAANARLAAARLRALGVPPPPWAGESNDGCEAVRPSQGARKRDARRWDRSDRSGCDRSLAR